MSDEETAASRADPWVAADALREVADAQRAVTAGPRPSPLPRVVQALTVGAMVGVNAFPAGAWTIYVILALPVFGGWLSARVGGDRVQFNGLQVPGSTGVRVIVLVGLLALIGVVLGGNMLWGWSWWVLLLGGALLAVLTFAFLRAFDLRVWRRWGGA